MQAKELSNSPALRFFALLLACMLAPLALVSLWPVPAGIHVLWDWANAMGYLALALFLLLFIYRGRARAFPPYSGRFFANLHRDLGYIALLMTAAHVGVLLMLEPLLLEHLKPTAPLHMLSGLLASLLMLLLVLSSVPWLRRRLWPDYHFFRHMHALLAVAILALAFQHVWASGFYLNSRWKSGIAVAAIVSIPAWYALKAYRPPSISTARSRDSARFSHLISYSTALAAMLASLVLALAKNLE